MGLLDGALGGLVKDVLGGQQGQAGGDNPLLGMAMQLLNQSGGLAGLLDRFKQQGLGREVDSWVGTGANLPLSLDQLKQVLGGGTGGGLAALAGQLGLSEEAAGDGLARSLPELVNQLTPEGRVPDSTSLEEALGQLGGKLFKS